MKYEQAYEECKIFFENDGIGELDGVAFNMALNALEKQIPKKVHFHHSREKGFCPNCLSVEDRSANYCRCCGQLLDFDIADPTEKGGDSDA